MHYSLIGNSGSGKSTLAKQLAKEQGLEVLDLDQIAWEQHAPTTLRDTAIATKDVVSFCSAHPNWVVEGCYTRLIKATLSFEPELILLDPGERQCLSNCRNRTWEPSKYSSKAAQDENLDFLLDWVSSYYLRDGDLSYKEHLSLFNEYVGPKQRLTEWPLMHSVADGNIQ